MRTVKRRESRDEGQEMTSRGRRSAAQELNGCKGQVARQGIPSPLIRLPRERGIRFIALLVFMMPIAAIAGCDAAASESDESFLLAKARAAVAFAEAETERHKPDVAPSTCDACRGTGRVRSGDGLVDVPCPCGSNCQCVRPTASESRPRERSRRLLYFTAKWCANCRANEPTFIALMNAGWKIGEGGDNHIQVIDFDAATDLRTRFAVDAVPMWIMIDDTREVRRRYGVLDPFAVGRLFDE